MMLRDHAGGENRAVNVGGSSSVEVLAVCVWRWWAGLAGGLLELVSTPLPQHTLGGEDTMTWR